MRFSLSLSVVTLLVGIASACTPGEYKCGTGASSNTVMLCDIKGVFVPLQPCPDGMTCKNIGANGAPTCA